MFDIAWNRPENRTYESGVDRGVLYVEGSVGVAWDGLTAVNESPTGGEATPYYLDGFKYLNVASSEEFEATIEAFSAPSEFAPCDGISEIANGLFLTEQPRKSFGFSYRTRVGNALTHDAGYKIHLVYNALAAPSERANATITNEVEPTTRSWAITTRPPRLPGHKPTAHIVIDTRITPRRLLREIEGRLYGSDIHNPHLPTPAELVTLIQEPVVAINLATNPSFETAAQDAIEVRRNLILNPSFSTGLDNWIRYQQPTLKWVQNDPNHYPGGNGNSVRVSKTGSHTAQGVYTMQTAFSAGTRLHGIYRIKALPGVTVSAGFKTDLGPAVSAATVPDDGEWHEIHVFRMLSSFERVGLQINVLNSETFADGDVLFYLDSALMEISTDQELPYFDGSTSPDPDLTPAWVGTAGASASVLRGQAVAAVSSNTAVHSTQWAKSGIRSVRVIPTGDSVDTYAEPKIPLEAGKSYTLGVTLRLDAPQTDSRYYRARRIVVFWRTGTGPYTVVRSQPAPNEAGEHNLLLKVTIPEGVTETLVRLYNGAKKGGGDVWFDDLYVVEGDYGGPAFSGDTPDRDGYFYSWVGEPNNSQSELRTWH